MTREEIAEVRERHYPEVGGRTTKYRYCPVCSKPWPCDAATLLEALDRVRAVASYAGFGKPEEDTARLETIRDLLGDES